MGRLRQERFIGNVRSGERERGMGGGLSKQMCKCVGL